MRRLAFHGVADIPVEMGRSGSAGTDDAINQHRATAADETLGRRV